MALINCPDCGKEISESANTCPECGYPVMQRKQEEMERQRKAQEELRQQQEEERKQKELEHKEKSQKNKKKYICFGAIGAGVVVLGIVLFMIFYVPKDPIGLTSGMSKAEIEKELGPPDGENESYMYYNSITVLDKKGKIVVALRNDVLYATSWTLEMAEGETAKDYEKYIKKVESYYTKIYGKANKYKHKDNDTIDVYEWKNKNNTGRSMFIHNESIGNQIEISYYLKK